MRCQMHEISLLQCNGMHSSVWKLFTLRCHLYIFYRLFYALHIAFFSNVHLCCHFPIKCEVYSYIPKQKKKINKIVQLWSRFIYSGKDSYIANVVFISAKTFISTQAFVDVYACVFVCEFVCKWKVYDANCVFLDFINMSLAVSLFSYRRELWFLVCLSLFLLGVWVCGLNLILVLLRQNATFIRLSSYKFYKR